MVSDFCYQGIKAAFCFLVSAEMLELKVIIYIKFQEFVVGVLLHAVGKAGTGFLGSVKILLYQD